MNNKSFDIMNRYETINNFSRSINDDDTGGALHQILPTYSDMNWSSWTGFPLTPEQIHNSFANDEIINLSSEKVEVDTFGDKNEDVDEELENIYIINARKYGLPIKKIDTSDEISSTIGKEHDCRLIIPRFLHHVTPNEICEQQSSSDVVSSMNHKGEIELDLALEGLRGITTALDRLA